MFGQDYSDEGATLLRIVALTAIPATVVNGYFGALRVMKRIGELAIIAGAVTATTITLSFLLLPSMGLEGAGVGYAAGQVLGLTIVLTRVVALTDGTIWQRLRWLSAGPGARS